VALRRGRWAAALTALFLAFAGTPALAQSTEACVACHGADGNSAIPGTPSLAAQPRIFLENYLILTREGLRGTEVMQALLKGVPDAQLVALAKHFAALPAKSDPGPVDEALFRRGRELAETHNCGSCHLPDYRGREQMPRLAGQREEFLAEVMLQYRQNRRPGGDSLMSAALYGIPEPDFKALAHFLSRLK
jgi:cytochrome c553